MKNKLLSKNRILLFLSALSLLFLSLAISYVIAQPRKSFIAQAENNKYIQEASVTLKENIIVNYQVNVPEGYTSAIMEFTFLNNNYTTKKNDLSAGIVTFSFDKVTPQFLAENISANLTMLGEGVENISETQSEFSIKSYAEKLLNTSIDELNQTENENTTMKTLLVDLLYYGQEAQLYTAVQNSSLIENLTETQKSYKSSYQPLTATDYNQTGTASDKVRWKGASLWFDYNISMKFYFESTIEGVTLHLTKANDTVIISDFTSEYDQSTAKTVYSAIYKDISVTEFDKIISVQLFDGTQPVGKTATYSVKSYIYAKQNDVTMGELAKTTYNYGLSAKAYSLAVADSSNYYLLSLENAWTLNGSSQMRVKQGSSIPENLKFATNQTLVGWYDRINNLYYNLSEFIMPSNACSLTAVYDRDFVPFVTSDKFGAMPQGTQTTQQTHELLNDNMATTYNITGGVSANAGYIIYNNQDISGLPTLCPIKVGNNLAIMTFRNNGVSSISIRYEVEFYGVLGGVNVTIPAGATVNAPLYYNSPSRSEITSYHQLWFTSATTEDVSLTIYGKCYSFSDYTEHSINLVGGTFDGTLSTKKLTPFEKITSIQTDTAKNIIAIKTSNSCYYETVEEFISNFEMPANDTTVTIIYEGEVEGSTWTPSCIYKPDSVDNPAKTGVHTADGKNTTYEFDTSVSSTWLICNSANEPHDVPNGCPVSTAHETLYVLTFTNNSENDVTIKFGNEFWGAVKNPITLTIKAGETIEKAFIVGTFTNTTYTYHQLDILSGAGIVSLTIGGVIVE